MYPWYRRYLRYLWYSWNALNAVPLLLNPISGKQNRFPIVIRFFFFLKTVQNQAIIPPLRPKLYRKDRGSSFAVNIVKIAVDQTSATVGTYVYDIDMLCFISTRKCPEITKGSASPFVDTLRTSHTFFP